MPLQLREEESDLGRPGSRHQKLIINRLPRSMHTLRMARIARRSFRVPKAPRGLSRAAIDRDGCAGNMRSQIGSEKFDDPGSVFRCSPTTQRHGLQEIRTHAVKDGSHSAGADKPRRDTIGGDPIRPNLSSQIPRVRNNGRLRGTVMSVAARRFESSSIQARDRYESPRALRLHGGRRRAACVGSADEISLQDDSSIHPSCVCRGPRTGSGREAVTKHR